MSSSASLPAKMKALVLRGTSASVSSIPLPQLKPSHLLVRVHSVALNPTDWKHISAGMGADPFSIVGCDYSGTVVSVGDQVRQLWNIGDRVFGCGHGCNSSEPYDGVFAEYAAVRGELVMKVPSNVSMDDASTIGLGSITVGQGLFQPKKGLGLNMPDSGIRTDEWVLVYGGSTATGGLSIQLAKLAGYKVATTCSPRNEEFVRSLGADAVFDYNAPDCGKQIRDLTENKLRYVWDTIAADLSVEICDQAISSTVDDRRYCTILPKKLPTADVKSSSILMYTVFGEAFQKGDNKFPASQADYDFGKKWFVLVEKLVREGKLKKHPSALQDGGLDGILDGLEKMESGRVRGEKLVYRVQGGDHSGSPT